MSGNGPPATSDHTPDLKSIPTANTQSPGLAPTKCCAVALGRRSRAYFAIPGGTSILRIAATFGLDSVPARVSSAREDRNRYSGACAGPYRKPDHRGSLGATP